MTYNQPQQLVFTNGTSVTVRAISPRVVGANQYTFVNWNNGGDTSQTFNVTANVDLLATYKIQYRLFTVSSVGNTFGGGVFYDSASNPTFGVLEKN